MASRDGRLGLGPSALEESCETCRFRRGDSCRRLPPAFAAQAYGYEREDLRAVWPTVYDGDWCGEYQRTEAPDGE